MRYYPLLALLLFATKLPAQDLCQTLTPPVDSPPIEVTGLVNLACPELQNAQQSPQPQPPASPDTTNSSTQDANKPPQQTAPPADQDSSKPPEQPKRILGVMPNFRAVSAGTLPPPPTPKQSFMIATNNSFDYSAFLFNGFTSLEAIASDAHPELGKGIAGYGRYYWRGFLDRTDGNYFVIFILPTILHQDERYYAMGKGGFLKRAIYSASRILITPNYEGHNTFNTSEVFGRGIAQAVSISYYPSQSRTAGSVAKKYGFAIGRDALTNVFREFWPDISVHVLHRKP